MSVARHRGVAGRAGSSEGTSDRTRLSIGETSIAAALGTVFNVWLLNLAFVVTSIPIITLPITMSAAVKVIEGWRRGGEDRVMSAYWTALTSRSSMRAALVLGVPLAAMFIGLEEVHFFAGRGTVLDQVCLGLGLACLLVVGTGFGYALVLSALAPGYPATDVWVLSVRWAIRNFARTALPFLVEIGAAFFLAGADPALCLAGLPILLLMALRRTAIYGLRRLDVDLAPIRKRE